MALTDAETKKLEHAAEQIRETPVPRRVQSHEYVTTGTSVTGQDSFQTI